MINRANQQCPHLHKSSEVLHKEIYPDAELDPSVWHRNLKEMTVLAYIIRQIPSAHDNHPESSYPLG